jgi:hypothetical protein
MSGRHWHRSAPAKLSAASEQAAENLAQTAFAHARQALTQS